jgi:hypothetical protein
MQEARTKAERHPGRFGLGRVMSMVVIESARTKTGDARLATAGPPRQHRSNEPNFDDDTMSYLDEIGSETTAQAPRQPRARTSCQTW